MISVADKNFEDIKKHCIFIFSARAMGITDELLKKPLAELNSFIQAGRLVKIIENANSLPDAIIEIADSCMEKHNDISKVLEEEQITQLMSEVKKLADELYDKACTIDLDFYWDFRKDTKCREKFESIIKRLKEQNTKLQTVQSKKYYLIPEKLLPSDVDSDMELLKNNSDELLEKLEELVFSLNNDHFEKICQEINTSLARNEECLSEISLKFDKIIKERYVKPLLFTTLSVAVLGASLTPAIIFSDKWNPLAESFFAVPSNTIIFTALVLSSVALATLVKFACEEWSHQNKLKAALNRNVESLTNSSNNVGAWVNLQ